jgi:hypothetical protein
LSFVSYDDAFRGLACEDTLWGRMNGKIDRVYHKRLYGFLWEVPTNKHRSVKHARDGIVSYTTHQGHAYFAHIVYDGNGNVVLSPIVLDTRPRHGDVIPRTGYQGWVKFDCEMQTNNQGIEAEDVVYMTGFGLYPMPDEQLQSVIWHNNHEITFHIPDLSEDKLMVDFLVYANNARSLYNGVKLDGNTWPADSNGVGPDSDCYNWSARLDNIPVIDFEDGEDGEVIFLNYYRYGLIFPQGYDPYNPVPPYFDWKYRTPNPQSNVYPYHASLDYPLWWIDAKFHAWMGDLSERDVRGRIGFFGGATRVCFGHTCTGMTSIGYGNGGQQIYWDNLAHPVQENNPLSHSLKYETVGPPYPPYIAFMDSIVFLAQENTFGIDNIAVSNHVTMGMGALPPSFFNPQTYVGSGYNNESKSYAIQVDETVDSLQVILNWTEADTREMQLGLINPNGETVFDQRSGGPPIMLDPIMADPMPGEWHAKVSVFSS